MAEEMVTQPKEEMRSMEVCVGTSVNEDAHSAWEEASQNFRGTLKSVGVTPGWLAASVLIFFACGSLLLSSKSVPGSGDWKDLAGLGENIRDTVSRSGDLVEPIDVVESANVVDSSSGLSFLLVRAAAQNPKKRTQSEEDPLSSFPEEMIVREFESYLLVLNKFPVFQGHSLLVTKEFVPQSARLTRLDLDALHRCVYAADALGFYNSHQISGSSQPHRHLQLVPVASVSDVIGGRQKLPGIFAEIDKTPHEFWRWSSKTPFFPVVRRLPAFGDDVAHGLVRLPDRATFDVDFGKKGGFADALLRSYVVLASDLGILGIDDDAPHNVLIYKDWILVVKRSQPSAFGVSVNGLAFAAILLIRDATTYASFLANATTATPRDVLVTVS